MTTSVQRRRGTTSQHSTFTGLEGEITIDTTKDTAVIHDGSTVGGFPLAKENLANANPTSLSALTGATTASDDLFVIYDTSTSSLKKITREELNNAMEADAFTNITISGGSINGTAIGAGTASTGNFSTLSIGGTAITSTATELNLLDGVTATTAEINFIDGVTSNIQTQLDAKAPLASPSFTGTLATAGLNLTGNGILGTNSSNTLQINSTTTFDLRPTFTAGTANQVQYLDGSKLLSGSSNMTFDGTKLTVASFRNSGLTSGRITYATTGGDLTDSANLTFNGSTLALTGISSIDANSSSAALRITQIGAGNALLVEDSANPDASPFVIDQAGQVGIGTATPSSNLQVTSDTSCITRLQRNSTDASAAGLFFIKQRGTLASPLIVSSGDVLGTTRYYGNDGTSIIEGARIDAAVDGTPATASMAGRLIFSTTTSGASSPTEKVRIDNAGGVGIGTSTLTGYSLNIAKTITGATTGFGIRQTGQIQSDVTSVAYGFITQSGTQAATFTLGNLRHFQAGQGTFGANSAVTTQTAYRVENTLTGATNNWGFSSDIAAGTGRWNLYMTGTADNYMAGSLGIGQTNLTDRVLGITKTANAVATSLICVYDGTFPATVTNGQSFISSAAVGTGATLSFLQHFRAQQGVFSGTVTDQYGFHAASSLTGATNDYGFFSNIAAGTGLWNFYANGTADNYLAGRLIVSGATAIPAGGTAGVGVNLSTTANFGVFFGSGAPTLSAAKGSLYLRSDGSTTNDRMYVNTNGSTTWTAVTTAA